MGDHVIWFLLTWRKGEFTASTTPRGKQKHTIFEEVMQVSQKIAHNRTWSREGQQRTEGLKMGKVANAKIGGMYLHKFAWLQGNSKQKRKLRCKSFPFSFRLPLVWRLPSPEGPHCTRTSPRVQAALGHSPAAKPHAEEFHSLRLALFTPK